MGLSAPVSGSGSCGNGGLNPDNAQEAIREVAPFGLDICSGVRTDGRLDEVKLKKFFGAIEQQPFA